jgi:predicted TIM-barrel fold metal-dependent hydrolase
MKFAALFAHSGPEVFKQHMDLCAIDRAMLLPVAQAEGDINSQMRDMKDFFSADERFLIGWSVSNEIKNEDILKETSNALKNYNICSIKQNFTQCEIDISQTEGKTRLESILEACNRLNLPLILHTGRSPLAGSAELSQFGEIQTLETFDWGSYTNPVVFAHSAAYGYSADEIQNYIIPRLKNLFSAFEHIFIDISGVDISGMQYLLDEIPTERILFGSDALYEPQWQRMVKLLFALEKSSVKFEESFVKIMSHNPQNYIFSEATFNN